MNATLILDIDPILSWLAILLSARLALYDFASRVAHSHCIIVYVLQKNKIPSKNRKPFAFIMTSLVDHL